MTRLFCVTDARSRKPTCRATAWARGFIAAFAAIAALMGAPQFAAAEAPARYMQRVAAEMVSAARSGSQSDFERVIRSHSDYTSIGLYSLGDYRGRLANSDRRGYFDGMIGYIARYAAKEAPKYPIANAVVVGQAKASANGTYVDSSVTLRSGAQYDVRWLVIRRGNTWKVRDAQVVGFWMSPFLKDLFEKFIGDNGGNPKALVMALKRAG